jgi:hypothetical protein
MLAGFHRFSAGSRTVQTTNPSRQAALTNPPSNGTVRLQWPTTLKGHAGTALRRASGTTARGRASPPENLLTFSERPCPLLPTTTHHYPTPPPTLSTPHHNPQPPFFRPSPPCTRSRVADLQLISLSPRRCESGVRDLAVGEYFLFFILFFFCVVSRCNLFWGETG